MAKIKRLPSEAIIGGFKGTIDFYVHDGQPCARMWPRSPGRHRAPAVEAQWPAFAYIARAWNLLTPAMQALWTQMASGTIWSGRDLFTRSYLTGAFAYPTGTP